MKALGLQDIPVNAIDTAFRLRAVDDGWAAALAENIVETGRLRQPIEVRTVKTGGYRLIAGGHRLAAFKRLDRETIPAFVFDASDDEARLAEIDENLVRHELNPLDRATFLAERKALYEKLHPRTKRGGDRKSAEFKAENQTETISVCSFTKDTAERIGFTDRTIRLAIFIAEKLAPDVRAAIVGTPTAKIQADLLALAKLGPEGQRAVVALLVGEKPKATSVREAIALMKGRSAKIADGYAKLMTVWRHATAGEREQFVAFLRASGELTKDETEELEEAA